MLNSLSTGNKEASVSSTTEVEVPVSKLITAHSEAVGGDLDRELPNSIGGTDFHPPAQILERRTRLTGGNFATTDVQWNAVLSNYDPWTAWLGTPLVSSHLTGYNRLRGDMEIEVVVTAPPSCYGMYIVGAVSECPGGEDLPNGADLDDATSDNPFTLSQDVHALIDLSTSTTVRLKLPWVHPLDAINLTGNLSEQLPFWRLMIFPLSKLRSAATTDAVTATYQVYARLLPGYSLSVATYQAKGPLRGGRGVKFEEAQGPGKISGTLGKVGAAAMMIGEAVPFLAPFAGPVAIGSSLASKIASMFGFTRESTVETPDRVIKRLFSPLTVVDGVDGSESVGLMSDPSTSIDPRIGGGIEGDPCTYEDLFSRWTLVRSATWTSSDAPNHELLGFQVSPGICNELLGIKYPSVGAFVGMPFRYWRGSMEYMIVVPTSPFHRGTLQVSWDPVEAASTDNLDVTNRQSNVIFDVDTTNQLCIRIGYVSEQPCKEMFLFSASTTQSVALSTRAFNGVVSIRVQGALRAQTSPTTVDVLVFARPGVDMRFGVPAITQMNATTDGRTLGTWQLQAGGIADDAEPEETFVQMVGPAKDPYPSSAILWGEDIASVRALMQKPGFWIKFNTDVEASFAFYAGLPALPLYPPPPYGPGHAPVCPSLWSNASVREQFTWLGWYSSMYTGIRGSVRVKALGRNEPSASASYQYIEDGLRSFITCQACSGRDLISIDSGGGPVGVQVCPDLTCGGLSHGGIQPTWGDSGGQEFIVPYYGYRKFESPRRVNTYASTLALPGISGWGRAPMFAIGQMSALSYPAVSADTFSIPPLAVFVGGGPDIAPVRFRRCPALRAPTVRSLILTTP